MINKNLRNFHSIRSTALDIPLRARGGRAQGQDQDVSVDCVMRKKDEYRQHAAEAFELAKRITDKADRAVMLAVAKGWLDLAERCMHRPEASLVDRPLVREMLGPVGGNRPSNTYRALLISIGEELNHRYEPPPELSPQLTRLVVRLEKKY